MAVAIGDGVPDVVTGTGYGGGPVVKVFDGVTFKELASFFACEGSFRGGVYVTVGDVDGDGRAEIITGVGTGGGPVVRVFRADGPPVGGFAAYEESCRGGVYVAAGDLDGDGRAEIVTGAGAGGSAHVLVFNGDLTERAGFEASDGVARDGVRVAVADTTGDGRPEVIAATGPAIRAFDPVTGEVVSDALAEDVGYLGGVAVG